MTATMTPSRATMTIDGLCNRVVDLQKRKMDMHVKAHAIRMDHRKGLMVTTGRDSEYLPVEPNRYMHGQIASKLGIPQVYYIKMQESSGNLLATNVNHWLDQEPNQTHLVRAYRTADAGSQGLEGRALLSDRFLTLDYEDVLAACLPAFGSRKDLNLVSAEVTPKKLYIEMTTDRLTGEVRVGDIVQGGIRISNSEVGAGALNIEMFFLRLQCMNGMVGRSIASRKHIGQRNVLEGVNFSDRTKHLDVGVLSHKMRDGIVDALREENFQSALAVMRESGDVRVKDVNKALDAVGKTFSLRESEKPSVLEHMIKGGDSTLWGLANAITAASKDVEDYDRGAEMREMGFEMLSSGALIAAIGKD